MIDAKQMNELVDKVNKMAGTINGDLLSNIKNLSKQAEEIAEKQNPVTRTFEIELGERKISCEVRKNGNIIVLSQSNGIVEEIIKRLQNDRHT